jgi:hypothetical protein
MDGQQLIDILEDVVSETRRYSGRSMYGKECVAFECDRGEEMFMLIEILSEATHNYEPDVIDELAKVLKGAKTDSMGLGMIVYTRAGRFRPALFMSVRS